MTRKMTLRTLAMAAFLAAPLLVLGCSSSDSNGGGGGADSGMKPDTGTKPDTGMKPDGTTSPDGTTGPDGSSAGLTLTGTVLKRGLTGTSPLSGVTVTVDGVASVKAATTDAKGQYTLTGVPANKEAFILFKKLTFLSVGLLLPSLSKAPAAVNAQMLDSTTLGALAGLLGFTADSTKGHVFFAATGTKNAGVSITLSGGGGKGPFYSAASGLPNKALTETSTNGAGIIANVTPGTYDLTVKHNKGGSCATVVYGWKSSSAGKIKVMVQKGIASTVVVDCK